MQTTKVTTNLSLQGLMTAAQLPANQEYFIELKQQMDWFIRAISADKPSFILKKDSLTIYLRLSRLPGVQIVVRYAEDSDKTKHKQVVVANSNGMGNTLVPGFLIVVAVMFLIQFLGTGQPDLLLGSVGFLFLSWQVVRWYAQANKVLLDLVLHLVQS